MRHDSSSSAARGTGPYSKPIDPKEAFAAAFGKDKKERKAKPAVRVAGGQVWEDATLTEEWDQGEFSGNPVRKSHVFFYLTPLCYLVPCR